MQRPFTSTQASLSRKPQTSVSPKPHTTNRPPPCMLALPKEPSPQGCRMVRSAQEISNGRTSIPPWLPGLRSWLVPLEVAECMETCAKGQCHFMSRPQIIIPLKACGTRRHPAGSRGTLSAARIPVQRTFCNMQDLAVTCDFRYVSSGSWLSSAAAAAGLRSRWQCLALMMTC